jgi:hypothetical protein
MNDSFSTPVLLIIFNRPDTTREVFGAIRKIRPKYLYIAGDGPRKDQEKDNELCRDARAITKQIDWDCDVHTLFQEHNLGCKRGVSTAITWFFENVERGIILEDDCIPDPSFFGFCENLLDRYRDDERVMMISGTNYFFDTIKIIESYFFSRWYIVWGWATWRRAWDLYDIQMKEWPKFRDQKYLDFLIPHRDARDYYTAAFQMAYENAIDSWAIPWWYSCIFQNGLVVTPKYNLISNIGKYGHFADGKKYEAFLEMPTRSLDNDSMVHPAHVIPNVPLTNAIFDIKLPNIRRKQYFAFIRQTLINLATHPVQTISRFINRTAREYSRK